MSGKYIDISDLLKLRGKEWPSCSVPHDKAQTQSVSPTAPIKAGDTVSVIPKKKTNHDANVRIKVTSVCSEKITGQITDVARDEGEDDNFYSGANVEVAIEKIECIYR